MVKNGIHKILYAEVLVENGYVIKVWGPDKMPAEILRNDLVGISRHGIHVKKKLKFETLRSGIYNGTYQIDW